MFYFLLFFVVTGQECSNDYTHPSLPISWKILPNKITYFSCKNDCENQDGYKIASIHSEEEHNYIWNNILSQCFYIFGVKIYENVHFGLVPMGDDEFYYADDTPYDFNSNIDIRGIFHSDAIVINHEFEWGIYKNSGDQYYCLCKKLHPIDCIYTQSCGLCSAECGINKGFKQCYTQVSVQAENGGEECPDLEYLESCNNFTCTTTENRDCYIPPTNEWSCDDLCIPSCGEMGTQLCEPNEEDVIQAIGEGLPCLPENMIEARSCGGDPCHPIPPVNNTEETLALIMGPACGLIMMVGGIWMVIHFNKKYKSQGGIVGSMRSKYQTWKSGSLASGSGYGSAKSKSSKSGYTYGSGSLYSSSSSTTSGGSSMMSGSSYASSSSGRSRKSSASGKSRKSSASGRSRKSSASGRSRKSSASGRSRKSSASGRSHRSRSSSSHRSKRRNSSDAISIGSSSIASSLRKPPRSSSPGAPSIASRKSRKRPNRRV